MRTFKRVLVLAGASVAAMTLAGAASASTVVVATGADISGTNPVGTLPATVLHTGNSYDFTFELSPPIVGDSATQVEAQIFVGLASDPELIQYQVYSGAPGSGTLVGTSALAYSPTVSGDWAPGDYYINITSSEIAKNGETVSGSFITTAVPEPASWGMLLFGVGLVGSGMRIARRKPSLALG